MKTLLTILLFGALGFADEDKGFDLFKNWYKSNSQYFTESVLSSNFNYELKYISTELKEWKYSKEHDLSYRQFKKRVNKAESFTMLLSISHASQNNPLEFFEGGVYENKLDYLNNEVLNDLYLITNSNDTIKPLTSHFERLYGVSGKVSVLFHFKCKKRDIKSAVYRDRVFIDQQIDFQYKSEIINNIQY